MLTPNVKGTARSRLDEIDIAFHATKIDAAIPAHARGTRSPETTILSFPNRSSHPGSVTGTASPSV